MQNRALGWPRAVKRVVVVALDIALAMAATWFAFTLRLDALRRAADNSDVAAIKAVLLACVYGYGDGMRHNLPIVCLKP